MPFIVALTIWAMCGCMLVDNEDGSSMPSGGSSEDSATTDSTTFDNPGSADSGTDAGDATDVGSELNGGAQGEVIELVNARREQGADCGSAGSFAPAGPLAFNEVLAVTAQEHSTDMSVRDYFDHTNPDGDGPGERIDAAGYQWSTWAENIAAGQRTSEEVVDGWMNSDSHCSNIMNPAFLEIGVGFAADGFYWTQVFGAPR